MLFDRLIIFPFSFNVSIQMFLDHRVFEVRRRKKDRNFDEPIFLNDIKAIWVLRWKLKDGKKIVKARLCLQGFRDKQHMESVASSTASRAAQRAVASTAANHLWHLLCLDISTALYAPESHHNALQYGPLQIRSLLDETSIHEQYLP